MTHHSAQSELKKSLLPAAMEESLALIEEHLLAKTAVKFEDNAVRVEVLPEKLIAVAKILYHQANLPLKLITATDESAQQGGFTIWYVFGVPQAKAFIIVVIRLKDSQEFPSLTPTIHEAWDYESKIQTLFGLTAVGHPDPRPIILHENWPNNVFPLRKDFAWQTRPALVSGIYQFQTVEGDGVYEIPVGPIHAGIIEPGHFRFSVAGEQIVLLEPRLGFVHKGVEKLFETLAPQATVRLAEKVSGDSSFSHSLALCQALEQLAGRATPARGQMLRVIYAELERLANHLGDIGAIMLDTGFNFGGAHGSRLREMVMRINERLTGSRFLRGVNQIGGVTKDLPAEEIKKLAQELDSLNQDFLEVITVAENSASLFNRLENTGILLSAVAQEHGVVGVAARATGLARDTRFDFPYAAYGNLGFTQIETEPDGDVRSRFRVRVKEVNASIALVKKALLGLPKGPIASISGPIVLKKDAIAISLVEGWRGEIAYFVSTDSQGKVSRVAPRDPSFINWAVLGAAGFGNIVPDFPLINKSFNLSYTGNDL